MAKYTHSIKQLDDGSIDIDYWLAQPNVSRRSATEQQLLANACALGQLTPIDARTDFSSPCFQHGLEMAELLLDLNVDAESIATAIVYPSYKYSDLSNDNIQDELGDTVANLASTVAAMDAISQLGRKGQTSIDTLRKMLLAMVQDIRGVLIKLAERVIAMRHIKHMEQAIQHDLAQETMDIYAPLANRLGIFQLKWELEDLGFRYLEPETYQAIAKSLVQRRHERLNYVASVTDELKQLLKASGITDCEVVGRAKHIYSIHKKMQRKSIDYHKIYDATALRILVPTVEDCYAALSCVHGQWKHIADEFDDYITHPKSNGYQSLHTAVTGPQGHNIEVQIRTYKMHEESELGIAAHWAYKEGKHKRSSYDNKIAWLRQLFAWQQEVKSPNTKVDEAHKQVFEDRVYVFTPNNDIIDLPKGATPLDFAYHIHSEVGHRCRGAKVNGHIVPLTHQLNTGERIEIINSKQPQPSRDWINPQAGYLKSARARAKVSHWFKKLDYDKNVAEGEKIIEREAKNHHIKPMAFEQVYQLFNFKTYEDMLAALGRGDIKTGAILNKIPGIRAQSSPPEISVSTKINKPSKTRKGISIQGVSDLLTTPARCCKPVPGDNVIGYITRGQGITIHRQDCSNVSYAREQHPQRLTEVNWDSRTENYYPVDIYVQAQDRTNLVRDISAILSNAKLSIMSFNTTVDKEDSTASVWFTVEVKDNKLLDHLITQIQRLPNVIDVKRQ